MKLVIQRDQAKKMLGGVSFELAAQVQLTPDEAELVKRYRADREVLLQKEVTIPLTGRSLSLALTIGSLTNGQTFKRNDIAEILGYEESVKNACQSFRAYLDVMRSFGGREVVEL